jgi:hypothetical protein
MGEARALKELTVKLKSTNSSSTLGYVEKWTVVDVVHSNDTAPGWACISFNTPGSSVYYGYVIRSSLRPIGWSW